MRKLLKYTGYVFLIIGVLLTGGFIYLLAVASVNPPLPESSASLNLTRQQLDSNCYVIGNNWLRKSKSNLWEMYVEGKPFERGVINGLLAKELIHEQEVAFSEQINKLVPSSFYRNFLKYFIGWFNRDLENHIPEEYKLEIYGVSKSASHEFDYIGTPYQRLMNYHAAHDIGHALQNLALVGCSSFATWDAKSSDNRLLIGRNFDFYVGDRFAENKIIQFVEPEKGYQFMMITWGGMTGVVSGMNMQGLTITLNAAKSDVPSGSATPISILAREILQYSKNIEEAIAIAGSRKTFVSESFLIGSANDNKAVAIEITPDTLTVYDPNSDYIICTNHYESDFLGKSESNRVQMDESASVYRNERLSQLLDTLTLNTPEKTAAILRDKSGKNNTFIGFGNEKSINQLIAHHAIIFEPSSRKVWVSSNPWQLGAFSCYDLRKIFAMNGLIANMELSDSSETIAADSFLLTKSYTDFVAFRELKNTAANGENIDTDQLIALNPGYYQAYVLAGDYSFERKLYIKAKAYYESALKHEIATRTEERYILEQIRKCNEKAS
ncbi:MAG: C45 family peptidase [Bacteroidota bacterium]|nr:C45 family peptidase [Bacteroidota bacterium]